MPLIKAQFVEHGGWSSWAIARFGSDVWGPEYSHVDCVTSRGLLVGARDDVIDGIPSGVQIRHQGYEKWIRRDVWYKEVTRAQATAWDHHVLSGIGAKYDEDAIRGFVFNRRLHEKGAYICSAYFTHVMYESGQLMTAQKKLPFEFQAYSPNACAFGLSYLGWQVERYPAQKSPGEK